VVSGVASLISREPRNKSLVIGLPGKQQTELQIRARTPPFPLVGSWGTATGEWTGAAVLVPATQSNSGERSWRFRDRSPPVFSELHISTVHIRTCSCGLCRPVDNLDPSWLTFDAGPE